MRGLTTTGDDASSYERNINHYYVLGGVDAEVSLNDSWLMGFSAEFDYVFSGETYTHLSDVSLSLPDIGFQQRGGIGVRVSAPLRLVRGSISFVFEPYIRYWKVPESDLYVFRVKTAKGVARVGFVEPENETTQFGLKVGVEL